AIPRITEVADDDRKPAIAGDPPSPLRIPGGCRFRTRCPMAQPVCEQSDPALAADSDEPGHLAACHFAFTPAPSSTALTPAPSSTALTPAPSSTALNENERNA